MLKSDEDKANIVSQKNLRRVWEELTAPLPPKKPLEFYQSWIYITIMEAMKKRQTAVQFEIQKLEHVNDILLWLVRDHEMIVKLESIQRGYNPSTHDPMWVEVLTVKWA